VLVGTTASNVTYLSDYWSLSQWARRSSHAYAVFVPGRAVELVVPLGAADLLAASQVAEPGPARTYGSFTVERREPFGDAAADEERFAAAIVGELPNHRDSLDALIAAINARAPQRPRIAVEEAGMPAGGRERLGEALTGAELVEAEPIIRRARAVKTEREIELLRAAATLTETAANSAFSRAEPGVTERELALAYRAEVTAGGGIALASSWTSGRRSALPNGQAGDRPVRSGEQLRFDGGCRFELYCADIARTTAVGEPTLLLDQRYGSVLAGLEAAIAAVRPGATGGDIFQSAVGAVREAGMPGYERSHCGHGIGIENYDEPLIAAGVDTEIEAGMVLCLETPYYELGWGGVQVEDTIVVTDEGVERITQVAPRP
jgi:Xaa-Pro dipeptidase